ncbi:hypothetical protein [Bradyrhizobium sp. SRS-191]|uniref:hypothetical protein n=1 Tax=Bradyrhizobium sp. SRS-191 TaxID=2962606 RepID=UPI00211EE427|nr:hypothetical protein [Bradyrhizobium sp. SRS-191]
MAKDSHKSAGAHGVEKTGGSLPGLFADENELDRRAMWRLGWWGAGAVGAVGLAIFVSQAAQGWRKDRISAADLSRQAQLLQSLARDTQGEARQLGAAIETLNTDRDRLYARVTVLEQGLESVTGTLAKQSVQAGSNQTSSQKPAPLPQIAAVDSQPPAAASVGSAPSSSSPNSLPAFANLSPFMPVPGGAAATNAGPPAAPPPAAASADKPKPEPAVKPADADKPAKVDSGDVAAKGAETAEAAATAVQKTEFAVDLGGANSIAGLRALWRGLVKSNADLAALRPIIMLKEGRGGPGMLLRLGAGPLTDAAAAARICAALAETQRPCETTVYDGQRLAVGEEPEATEAKPATPAAVQKPVQRRRALPPQAQQQRHGKREEPPAAAAPPPPPAEAPKPEQPATLSSFFRRS